MMSENRQKTTGCYGERCRIFAAFLVMLAVFITAFFRQTQVGVAEDSGHALTVSDWGIFNESTKEETSLAGSGVIDGDSINGVLYIKFDHNVAESTVAENNCALISVVSADGDVIASDVGVRDTETAFQYRQYIFVEVTGNIDPDAEYYIKVAPGVTATDGYTNEEGMILKFSFNTSGSGDDPTPDPGGSEEEETKTDTGGSTSGSSSGSSSSKSKSKSKSKTSSSSSTKTRRNTTTHNTVNRPSTPAKKSTSSAASGSGSVAKVYWIDIGSYDDEFDEDDYDDEYYDDEELYDEDWEDYDDWDESFDPENMESAAGFILIALCLTVLAAGALGEEMSFRHRLRNNGGVKIKLGGKIKFPKINKKSRRK